MKPTQGRVLVNIFVIWFRGGHGVTMLVLRANAALETLPVSCLMKSTAYGDGF